MQSRTRRVARVRFVEEGSNAGSQGAAVSMSECDKRRLEKDVQGKATSGVLESLQQDGTGVIRRIYASGGSQGCEWQNRSDDSSGQRIALRYRSNDIVAGGQDEGPMPRSMEGFRDVWSGTAGFAVDYASYQGDGPGMGDATLDAGGITVAGEDFAGGSAVQAQRVRLPSTIERAETIQTHDASGIRVARRRRPAKADHPDHEEDDATPDAIEASHSGSTTRCGTHCGRHADLCSSGGNQASISMQKISPFSPDFSPRIPDFSPFIPDFSPREFRFHSSVLDCSVVCSQLRLLKIMIIGDRRRRSTRKATKSHLKRGEKCCF